MGMSLGTVTQPAKSLQERDTGWALSRSLGQPASSGDVLWDMPFLTVEGWPFCWPQVYQQEQKCWEAFDFIQRIK